VDTLFYLENAQTTMESIFGLDPHDVYVVGHCEVSGGRTWHFDGAGWIAVNVSTVHGYLNVISGSAPNDIWVVGGQAFFDPVGNRFVDSTLFVHYDGAAWNQFTGFQRSGELWCVAVFSPTSVFAGDGNGVLYRLYQGHWKMFENGSGYLFSSIAAKNLVEAYAMGHIIDALLPIDSSGSFLFQLNGSSWVRIDSTMDTLGSPPPHMGIGIYL
jgi:hypothetical protein